MPAMSRLPLWVAGLLIVVQYTALPVLADEAPRTVQTLKTSTGVAFGIWGEKPATPAPTLFILASTIEGTLGDPYYRRAGNILSEQGFLCVSIDLPCHGSEHLQTEPPQLEGWRNRCERGEDFVASSNKRLSQVLDHLIQEGYSDAEKICVCGTSRGGFLSLHFAAHDPRVRCVAAYAPVTDLVALREFHGAESNALVQSLDLRKHANKLAGRAVWLIIGDQDERVGTDLAIDLARRITKASLDQKLTSRVDLHVIAESRGHTTPDGAVEGSAQWILKQCPGILPAK